MCGVIAYRSAIGVSNPNDMDLLIRILMQSKIRGLHAFGVGTYIDGAIVTKRFLHLSECIDYVGSVFANVRGIIVHCRYSTSGDWQMLENNQPVVLGNSCLIFNGVISMKTKEGMEQEYGVKLNVCNDGELFLHQRDPEQFISSIRGSFAGVWIRDGVMYMMRNSKRPLWYIDTKVSTFVFSTRDIINRAVGGSVTSLAISCDANELYEIGHI
jgi:glutamine phosphoribosylpyrophosphate amidotransferase